MDFSTFASQWGIRRDPIVESLLVELKQWQSLSSEVRAEYDPIHYETRLLWPNEHPDFKPSNKAWRRFRDRFKDFSERISVYFEAKYLQTSTLRTATREHLELLKAARRLFGGQIIATRKRESK